MAKSYTLCACSTCGCAIGFATVDDKDTQRDRRDLAKTVGGWAAAGYVISTATTRDELDAHMKTWGDCACPQEADRA